MQHFYEQLIRIPIRYTSQLSEINIIVPLLYYDLASHCGSLQAELLSVVAVPTSYISLFVVYNKMLNGARSCAYVCEFQEAAESCQRSYRAGFIYIVNRRKSIQLYRLRYYKLKQNKEHYGE